jgi:hypothetical protein
MIRIGLLCSLISCVILVAFCISPVQTNHYLERFISCNEIIDSVDVDIETVRNSPFFEKSLSQLRDELFSKEFDSFSNMLAFMNQTLRNPPFYENVYEIKRKNGSEAVFYRKDMPFGFHVTHSPVNIRGVIFSDKIHSLMNSEPNATSRFWSFKNWFYI